MSWMKKKLIIFFIILNFLTMIRTHLPLENKFWGMVYKPIDSYLTFFSIYQDWMMFAPDPGKFNNYITAEVDFFDGSKDTYTFPRGSQLSIREKYQYGEKFRKFLAGNFHEEGMNFLWEDSAKFALRKMKEKSFEKIPMQVRLVRYWDEIPDLKKEFRKHMSASAKFQKYTFYTYEVIK
jgi:hypothetical protein